MGLQDLVFKLEVGSGQDWVKRITFLFVFLGLAMFYFITQFNGISEPSAMDSAQIARNMMRGEGFTTDFLRPSDLEYIQKVGDKNKWDSAPEIHMAPAYPWVLSKVFWITRTTFETKDQRALVYPADKVIAALNVLFLFGALLLTYHLGCSLFDQRAALIGVLLLLGTDLGWQIAMSGSSLMMQMFFVLAHLVALHKAILSTEDDGSKTPMWMGLSIGALLVGVLTAWSTLLILPMTVFLIVRGVKNGALYSSVAVLLGLGVAIAFWIRSHQFYGGWDWLSRQFYYDTNATLCWRSLEFIPSESLPKVIIRKFLTGIANQLQNLPILMGSFIVFIFSLCAFLHPFRRRRVRTFQWGLALALFSLIVGMAVFMPIVQRTSDCNLWWLLYPIFCLYAAAFTCVLIERLDVEKLLEKMISWVVIGLNVVPLLLVLAPPKEPPFRYPPYCPPVIWSLSKALGDKEAICSDIPWATAWYGDRTSLWLPENPKQFLKIYDNSPKVITGFLLTPMTQNRPMQTEIVKGELKDWAPVIMRTGMIREFPLTVGGGIYPNKDDYFFLTDRQRF